jgi:D-lactate dehydrogenase
MRLTMYSTRAYERPFFDEANRHLTHEIRYRSARLCENTVALAEGSEGIVAFVNDELSATVLERLQDAGVRLIALRSAGYNHVDLAAADRLGLVVLRVPAYSPYAVAEHTVGLMLALNRRFHRAYARVREQNFSLDGLMGFDMHHKTAGVIGTGNIGSVVCRILTGFGCRVLANDPVTNPACEDIGVRYAPLDELLTRADLLTLHCPLTPDTHHLIDANSLARMKPQALLINTSRGAVIDTRALIAALKRGHLGAVGLDVYEEESGLFFENLSDVAIQDDLFVRLMNFPNVLITAHQGFFTRDAMEAIAETTLNNACDFAAGRVDPTHRVGPELVRSLGAADA